MVNLNSLLDPRGLQERTVIQLAKRPTLEELKKGKILFYNNTKLGFCNYYTVFDRIKEHLEEIAHLFLHFCPLNTNDITIWDSLLCQFL